MRMKALKTFSPAGAAVVQRGQEFDCNDSLARQYETRGMAIFIGDAPPAPVPAPTEANPAAAAGPSGSAGGRTGAGKPLLSSQPAQAPKPAGSTRQKASRG